jgi:antagonist of KipI
MGLRLHGKEPIGLKLNSMISAATEFGTIQCLPDGDLTVLMADHPVTGGYPRVAILPYYEWSRLAQAIPGTVFELQLTEHNEVHSKNLSYMAAGRMFRETIRSAVQSYLQQHATEC